MRIKGHSYSQCRIILKAKFEYEVSRKNLIRWSKRLKTNQWDLKDKSKRPKTIYYKITPAIEDKIISHESVNKILMRYKLTDPPKRRRKRKKYVC